MVENVLGIHFILHGFIEMYGLGTFVFDLIEECKSDLFGQSEDIVGMEFVNPLFYLVLVVHELIPLQIALGFSFYRQPISIWVEQQMVCVPVI